ncbi:hypothetical protein [Ekhidna sp. To15]|uniref:hypothetical protein n=1 Tax=Ekhidna sp. To15 TaxID=3395267 RepID=UPI003F5249BF
MKKNLITISLILITVLSMFYAYVKANQATVAGQQIQELKQLLEEQKIEAESQAEMAMLAATEAKRQEALALEMRNQLEACQAK